MNRIRRNSLAIASKYGNRLYSVEVVAAAFLSDPCPLPGTHKRSPINSPTDEWTWCEKHATDDVDEHGEPLHKKPLPSGDEKEKT